MFLWENALFLCGLILFRWVSNLLDGKFTPFFVIHGSEQNPLRSNMRLAHHRWQTIRPIICSVKHTEANNKKGCWLLSDLFTWPCSLTDDLQLGSSSCAEAGGWGCCQTVAAMKGGFHHTVFQVLLTRLGPIWEEEGVSERVGPAATHSLSSWNRMGIYLFTPCRILLPRSVQIIDLFGRCQSCPVQDITQKSGKSPLQSPWLVWRFPPFT